MTYKQYRQWWDEKSMRCWATTKAWREVTHYSIRKHFKNQEFIEEQIWACCVGLANYLEDGL
jgi:hypothetical protein